MNDLPPSLSFTQAAQPTENLAIAADILAWFKKRGEGWQQEIEGVLDFYINTVEQPASDPDAFEPGEMDPAPGNTGDFLTPAFGAPTIPRRRFVRVPPCGKEASSRSPFGSGPFSILGLLELTTLAFRASGF